MKHLAGAIQSLSDHDLVDRYSVCIQRLQPAKSLPILSRLRILKKLFEHQLMISFERHVRRRKRVGGEAIKHTPGIPAAIDIITQGDGKIAIGFTMLDVTPDQLDHVVEQIQESM